MAVTIQRYETADNTMLEKCGHNYKIITGYLSFATYITGGVPMDMSDTFPDRLDFVMADQAMGGYVLRYDYTNRKMLVYFADYSTGTDSVLIEIADDTNLAAAVSNTHFVAIGK